MQQRVVISHPTSIHRILLFSEIVSPSSASPWNNSPKPFMGTTDDKAAELLQGTLDLLILKSLTTGEMHGYEIAEWIHAKSEQALSVEEGALYPALSCA
jgi:hypothetical protein